MDKFLNILAYLISIIYILGIIGFFFYYCPTVMIIVTGSCIITFILAWTGNRISRS